MKSKMVISTALLLMLWIGGPAAAAGAGKEMASDKEAEAIKAVIHKAAAGFESLDPTNAAPFYAKDSSLAFYDLAPVKYTGWDEYAAGVQNVFKDMASMKFSIGDDLQIHRTGKVAWTTATVGVAIVTKSGSKESPTARWTVVLEKRGNDWLITHEHFSVPMPVPDMSPQTLYKRLGGYDALAAVTDDFIGRLANDPQLHKFFVGHATSSLRHIRQLIVDQLCEATGGPCVYIGKDMKTAHAGMGISENDWQAAVKHLVATLDKFNVPKKEKDEVLGAISGMKKDIVNGK